MTLSVSVRVPAPEPVRPVISIIVADAAGFSETKLPGRAKAAQEVDLAFEVPGKLVERDRQRPGGRGVRRPTRDGRGTASVRRPNARRCRH